MDQRLFDVDSFIDEVEDRPAIWNVHLPEYSNKIAKQQAWDELAMIFYDPYDMDQNLRELGSKLQKRWKTLRDSYTREEKKLKNSKLDSEASPKISFRYYERLKFLQYSAKRNDSESANEMGANEIDQSNNIKRLHEDKINKIRYNPTDEYFIKILEKNSEIKKSMENKLDELDEDKLFCLSLCRELKKVPEKKRLKLKIEIYKLILYNQNSGMEQHHELSSFEPRMNVPANTGKRKNDDLQKDVGNKRLQLKNTDSMASVADSSTGIGTAVPERLFLNKHFIQNGDEIQIVKKNKYRESGSSMEDPLMLEKVDDHKINKIENNEFELLSIKPETWEVPIEFGNSCAEIKKELVDEEHLEESP